MQRSHGVDGDRVLAWSCVVLAHLFAGWWLTRPYESGIRAETDGLDVVWIEPLPPVAMMPPRTDSPPGDATSGSKTARADMHHPEVVAPTETPIAEAKDTPSLSAVFLEQGRTWAKEQHPSGDFARNPLNPRALSQADVRTDRFRMRDAITPADIVAGIGTLFGGGGDIVDCARVRDNIANLASGGASERLEEELRRDRKLCR